jgi:tRNA(Ile)-lysidine synthase
MLRVTIDVAGLEARVRVFARERTPALAAGRALVAVSGGADSVATAALLCEAGVLDAAASAVGHFDHRLRGAAAAARDRAAVEALCSRYGLDLATGAWADPRAGESAAREARYAFLIETASRHELPAIVTGHTSDDQAETVLLHTLRGAGLHGLRGMAAEREVGGEKGEEGSAKRDVAIARPMLCVSRDETRAYCAARGLAFADDETNADTRLLRNRVRLEVLPELERALPGATAALLRASEEARDAVAAVEAVAGGAIVAAADGAVTLSRAALRSLPAAVAPYAFRLAAERLLGDARELERRHYALLSRAAEARTGSAFDLPRGLVVTVDADAIVVSRGAPPIAAIPAWFEAPLPFAGRVGAWELRVVAGGEGSATLVAPAHAVVRRRRPGDWMRLRGGRKKLQDLFVDLKAPRRERDTVPVIAAGAEVLWTPFAVAVGDPEACDRWHVVAIRSGAIERA